MGCDRITTPDGHVAIVCSRGERRALCHFCSKPAPFLCDGFKPKKKSGTCDKRMCEEHRMLIDTQGDDTVDYCPECHRNGDHRQMDLFDASAKD